MAHKSSARLQRPIGEINMTPLIDLTFLLLITFVITFPMIQTGIPVRLPRGQAAELPAEHKRVITVDRQGRVFLDERASDIEQVRAEMMRLGQAAPNTVILIRADEGVPYGQVVRVLQVLHEAKLARLALVTAPGGKQGS